MSEVTTSSIPPEVPPLAPPAAPDIPDEPPGLGQVAAFRLWYRARRLPKHYSPLLHLLVHLGPLVAACVYAATKLQALQPWHYALIPASLIGSSYFVYWFHRDVLHRPRRFAYYAYRNHTLQHHRFFDYEHITPDKGLTDLHITLFPAFAGSVLAGVTLGLAWLIAPLTHVGATYLLVLMSNAYMLLYEFVHTASHLPEDHPLLALPGLRFLREHHRLHHDPALMGKYNFNVVLPLFDWWLGAWTRQRRPKR